MRSRLVDFVTRQEDLDTINVLRSIGLTMEEREIPFIHDEPKIPVYFSRPNDNHYLGGIECNGKGFDLSDGKARIKALAETLERISLMNPQKGRISKSIFNPGSNFVDPGDFVCYSNSQIKRDEFIEFLKSRELSWISATHLNSGNEKLVPAQAVFLSGIEDDVNIREEQISTGTAFGRKGTNNALENGLYESIERDACMLAHHRIQEFPPKVIIELPSNAEKLKRYLERYRLSVHIFDVKNKLDIPSVVCATIDETGIGDAVNFGSASGNDYGQLIEKSILESIQCRRAGRITRIVNPEYVFNKDPGSIKNIEERYLYCHSRDRIKDIGEWLDSKNNKTLPSQMIGVTFQETVESLIKKNVDMYVVDITLPEIEDAGFEVKKVLTPGLFPLYIAENAKALYSSIHGEIREEDGKRPHLFT